MVAKLNEKIVESLPVPEAGNKVHYFAGAVIQGAKVPRGFGVRVTSGGARSFVLNYRIGAAERRYTIGQFGDWSVLAAVAEARGLRQRIDRGEDPLAARRKEEAATETTFKAIAEDYLKRACGMKRGADGNASFSGTNIRTGDQRLDVFERLVYPDPKADENKGREGLSKVTLHGKQIEDVKRSDVVRLLDWIEDNNGARTAHVTLAYLSVVFNWHASRSDDFRSPIVRGMGRVKPKEHARTRVLTDEEVRDVWAGLDAGTEAGDLPSCYTRFVRALLLTAIRRGELADAIWAEAEHLKREDYHGETITIPAARMKGKIDHAVPLTPAVLALIGNRPKDAKARPFIFSTTDGKRPFSGFSKAKAALDKHIDDIRQNDGRDPIPAWVLHDLRRTAKTFMQRAGVRPDISERVLAHVITGVEGVYDRYGYLPEKRDALDRLAALIERIVTPRTLVSTAMPAQPAGDRVPSALSA